MYRIRIGVIAAFMTALLPSCGDDKDPIVPERPIAPEEPEEPEDEWKLCTDNFIPLKAAALLDLTRRNKEQEDGPENGRNLYSAGYILEVAGMPFFTTSDFTKAMSEARMILLSSPVKDETFTVEEQEALAQWVKDGGVLVAPACLASGPLAAQLFGIASSSYSKKRFFATWEDEMMTEKELEYMDEPEEKDFSLGNEKNGDAVKTYGYTLSSSTSLAHFNTGEPAVVRNELGEGCAYTFGLLWRDVIQRPQLNKDFSAQRAYSNGFEPSTDAFPLFVRSVYAKYNEASVFKSTVPDGYATVLIPTHDCDSRTAYDNMYYMSEYEKDAGVKGQYFLTTHYYRDPSYLSAFYDGQSVKQSRQLIADGHRVGSHSVGHFPDFNKMDRFPIVKVTKENYQAHHDVTTGITTGGSTWAEIALSKEILEADLGNKVRSFRSGHLMMNKYFPEVEEAAGYSFSSCYGAGDVLTCFPFFQRIGNEWTGRSSSVLEIPLHFSDVFSDEPMDDTNWEDKPAVWLKVMDKLAGNYAPSVLLIHPNRDWKMKAEKRLVESMDGSKYGLFNFEDYGNFWVNRHGFRFDIAYQEEENKVFVRADRGTFEKNPHISFIVETKSDKGTPEVLLVDENAYARTMRVKSVSHGRFMAY